MVNWNLLENTQETNTTTTQQTNNQESTERHPRRLPLFKDSQPHFVTFLSQFGIPLFVHFMVGFKAVICNKKYNEPCSLCEKAEEMSDHLLKAKKIKSFLGFVHDMVGTTFTYKEQVYENEPVKVIELRDAKDNLLKVEEAKQDGTLVEELWEIRRDGEGIDTTYSYLPVSPGQLKKLGARFNTEVPSDVLNKYEGSNDEKNEDSVNQVFRDILRPYDNVRWDLWGIPEHAEGLVVETEDEKETRLSSKNL